MTSTLPPSPGRYTRRIQNRWRSLGRSFTDAEVETLVAHFILVAAIEPPESFTDDTLLRRASGTCVCEACGLEYYDHPESLHLEWLHVLCDRRFVKL